MKYTYFLGKSEANTSNAPLIDIFMYEYNEFIRNKRVLSTLEKNLLDFDVEAFRKDFESRLIAANISGGQVAVYRTPQKNKPMIHIEVDWKDIHLVYAVLLDLVNRYRLFLLDLICMKKYCWNDYCSARVIEIHERAEIINSAINDTIQNIALFKEIVSDYYVHHLPSRSFAVVIESSDQKTQECFTQRLFDILNRLITSDEKLGTNDHCFTIESDTGIIIYCLEFMQGNECFRGSISNNGCSVEKINRPPLKMLYEMLNERKDQEYIHSRLTLNEMVEHYPNPLDRLHRSIAISDMLYQSGWSVGYTQNIMGGSMFNFFVVLYNGNAGLEKDRASSVLSIEEDDTPPLFAIIHEFYPYIWGTDRRHSGRYYAVENYLPEQMWYDIKERLLAVRQLLLNDPCSLELSKYAKRFGFPERYYKNQSQEGDEDIIKERARAIVTLYDIFIKWLEAQESVYWDDYMINVEGP